MTRLRAASRSIATLAAACGGLAAFGETSNLDALFPAPPEVRKILDQSCVFCHGEVIDGEAEIREDLDLSTDEKARETLGHLGDAIEMIETGEMPHEAKLSFRLRKRPEMRERLEQIRADYDESGSREVLLAWLKKAL